MAKIKKLPPHPDHMADKKHVSGIADPKADVMKIANEARSKANSASDEKREQSFNLGMSLIYGGTHGVAAKAGRA